jgi:L-rhamnose mutarotase
MIDLQENLKKNSVTNYQILIDSITNEIYQLYNISNNWDEVEAKQTSHKILTIVEEFQQKRAVDQ